MVLARVTAEPIDPAVCLAAVGAAHVGGLGLFIGTVRDGDHGRRVISLSYEAHPTAEEQLVEVCTRAAQRDVSSVAALHRVGDLSIGDAAVIVAVAAVHRAEALDTTRWLIDTIKAEVPLWKHQFFADGTDEWVGACS